LKTLVLGGYGNFGARICRALAGDPNVRLLIGGRDLGRAKALADRLGQGCEPVAIDLCGGWQRLAAIDMCIAPAQTAPRGEATLAAVLSYCGESIDVWEDGRWQARRYWRASARWG